MGRIAKIRCLYVLAQVNLGFFDEDENLVGEETFPQVGDNVGTAKLFHPHIDQLEKLIESCTAQAWAKLCSSGEADQPGEVPAAIVRMLAEKATDGAG